MCRFVVAARVCWPFVCFISGLRVRTGRCLSRLGLGKSGRIKDFDLAFAVLALSRVVKERVVHENAGAPQRLLPFDLSGPPQQKRRVVLSGLAHG